MARQLLQETSNIVIAACRDPLGASALQALRESASGTLYIVRIEVTDRKSIQACADEVSNLLGSSGIDYLINNAGVVRLSYYPRDFFDLVQSLIAP